MAKVNVSLPQGTRDFSSEVVWKRQYLMNVIRTVFELYGFQPLETPAMENLETLMGKYGEEGDRLIFKILNNGLTEPSKKDKARAALEQVLEGKNDVALTERALKYDLTIPFARYVAMNHHQLSFPFKRYQMQPVWRADRPQKGRYREFWQCDADVVGSTQLINEAELANLYHEVFQRLGLTEYSLQINSRKILAALAEACGGPQWLLPVSMAIDKMEKTAWAAVNQELSQRGLSTGQIGIIEKYLNLEGSNDQKLEQLKTLLQGSPSAKSGVEELETILHSGLLHPDIRLVLEVGLARGLNYYTGTIFEARAPRSVSIGSIGGGGRYDDLTGLFGVPGIPGVGISFGLDRIYDVLESLSLFPTAVASGTQVLFFNSGGKESIYAYRIMQQWRTKGIACEIYPEAQKFDRQFKYAERKHIPFVAITGSREMETGTLLLKDLRTGEQRSCRQDEPDPLSRQ